MNIKELKQKYGKYIDDIFQSAFEDRITGEKLYFCYLKDGYTTLGDWTSIDNEPLEVIEFYLKDVKHWYEEVLGF